MNYINHEPVELLTKNSYNSTTCKYCGCSMFYSIIEKKTVPRFSANTCLTYEEYIIKNIIE